MKSQHNLFIRRMKQFTRKFGIVSWRHAQPKIEINSTRSNIWSMFEEELSIIDEKMESIQTHDIPQLFSRIPLDVFGQMLLDIPSHYPHIKAFFPSMASEEVQRLWTGAHGEVLMGQSLAFVKTMISGYAAITGKKIKEAHVLDFGCGWGRLIRPLYKFTPYENIYAVDPWDESIKECEKHHIKANIALSEWVPKSLPFERQFDLIFAFSVLTHLSEKTLKIVLQTLRKYIKKDGVLVTTIRPKEYWHIHEQGSMESEMIKMHNERGFAFTPHNLPPIDGDITYGDTSISLAYIDSHFQDWRVESVELNGVDVHQIILFLKPV